LVGNGQRLKEFLLNSFWFHHEAAWSSCSREKKYGTPQFAATSTNVTDTTRLVEKTDVTADTQK